MGKPSIAVNGLRLLGARTAIGRHLEYLAQYWSRTAQPFTADFFVPGPIAIEGLGDETEVRVHVVGRGVPRLLWEQAVFPWAARRSVAMLGEYTMPIVAPAPRAVVANHGFYEALPTTFSPMRRFRATAVNRPSARRAVRVIANSLNTKADLQKYYGVPAGNISVVYPGPADVFFREHDPVEVDRAVRDVFGDRSRFIINVGKLSARRHVGELIGAMKTVGSAGLGHRLLIVGPDTSGVDPRARAAALGLEASIVHLDHLDQTQLALLYSAADAYVLASNYEGISWTMLEAMASGTAVISVDHPTLAESAGDAAHVVAEPTAAALAEAICTVLRDPELRGDLGAAGRARAARFSLEHSAQETTRILLDVARL